MSGLFCPLLLLLMWQLCRPEPNQQQMVHRFSTSIRLTRRIRARVQALLLQYKIQELGDSEFEDKSLTLQSLPTLDINYIYWLHMKDSERLSRAAEHLQSFWAHLDIKRQHMLEERRGRVDRLMRSMHSVQLDVRDLIRHVKAQLKQVNHADHTASNRKHGSAPAPPLSLLSERLTWHRHVQGYVVLRDLERFLGKLVRDFTLLKTKQRT